MIGKLTIPRRTDRHIYTAVFYGVVLMIWLSSESTHMLLTAALGIGLAFMVISLTVVVRFGGRTPSPKIWLPGMIALGALLGLSSVFMTFMLMLFKNVQHSHLALDFPGEVVADIWLRAPAWTIAGALLGGAIALARIAFYSPSNKVTL